MSNEPINYQSQIDKRPNEILINLAPHWWKISKNYFDSISIIIYSGAILGFIFIMETNFDMPILFICLFFLIGVPIVGLTLFMGSIMLNELTIYRTEITTNTKKQRGLRNIPFIDFYVEVLENKVKISMQDFKFSLKDVRDLPKLTESVAELLDLEFYDNYQIESNKKVLTYKAKTIAKPNFPSFLSIKNNSQKLQIHDITSQHRYIKIEKKSPITEIIYSIPDVEERYGTEYIVKAKDIVKIVVEVYQKGGILKNQHRIIIKGLMKNGKRQSTFLKTRLRSSQDELTNWRDSERIYNLLEAISNLNIPIEKVIIN